MALGIETRDGAVEAVERIRQLDGEVGPKGEDATAAAPGAKRLSVTEASTAVRSEAARDSPQHRLPGIRAQHALRTQALLHIAHV